ncbi:hypothetical protein MKW98_002263 [Papaver atlanticum]|uniref:Growth-regulating factor n=1 Tax=Papaver atlanticum TaxID=357466 RepID=A0AAD4RUG8_9MAGN|nr:hypothetical protein MKW98_002263 [Papaver atlanticum]
MDYYHLRDWRNQQHESDHAAKIPRLFLDQPHQETAASESSSALPLFVPDHEHHHHHQQLSSRSIISNLSAFPDSTNTSRVSRMIGLFSLAQWQELELQALIFKYMLAGATVPSELLQPIIKKSLFNNPPPSPFFLHQQYQHYQPTMLQSGYWGRTSVDPEPGRCRRTDGKKWRCSKDVVSGQKYCERHMHRGRNRSRKPVEISTRPIITNDPSSSVTIASVGNSNGLIKSANNTIAPVAALPLTAMGNTNKNGGNAFVISCGPSNSSPSMDLLHLNPRYCESERRSNDNSILGDGRTDGQVLRHFFDDWPKKSQHQPTNGVDNSADRRTSSTCLSISIENGEEHHNHPKPSSDFSLKLATGVEDESGKENCRDERSQVMNWGGMSNSMGGGPLAEALRSSSNSSSPTSVLHPPPQVSVSESSSIITK